MSGRGWGREQVSGLGPSLKVGVEVGSELGLNRGWGSVSRLDLVLDLSLRFETQIGVRVVI